MLSATQERAEHAALVHLTNECKDYKINHWDGRYTQQDSLSRHQNSSLATREAMDPLSITTSCLALIGVVGKTSIAITGFIRDCREARGDLTSVNRELSDLKIVLELLKDDTANQDDELLLSEQLRVQILSIITNCSDVSAKVEKVLVEMRGSRVGAIKWVLNSKKEVASLKQSLEAHRSALSLALEMVNISITKAVKEDTGVIREDVGEIKQDTAQILEEIERLKERLPLSDRDFVLQGYLDSLTTYAATVYDELDHDGDEHAPLPGSSSTEAGHTPPSNLAAVSEESRHTPVFTDPDEEPDQIGVTRDDTGDPSYRLGTEHEADTRDMASDDGSYADYFGSDDEFGDFNEDDPYHYHSTGDRCGSTSNASITHSNTAVSGEPLDRLDDGDAMSDKIIVPAEVSSHVGRSLDIEVKPEEEEARALPPSAQAQRPSIQYFETVVSGSQVSRLIEPKSVDSIQISQIRSGDFRSISKGTNNVIAFGRSHDGIFGAFVQKDRVVSVWDMNHSTKEGEFKRKRFGISNPDNVQVIHHENDKNPWKKTGLYVLIYSTVDAAYEVYRVSDGKLCFSSKGVYGPKLLRNLRVISITKKGKLESVQQDWAAYTRRGNIAIPLTYHELAGTFGEPRLLAFSTSQKDTKVAFLSKRGYCSVASFNFSSDWETGIRDVTSGSSLMHFDADEDLLLGMEFSSSRNRVVLAWRPKQLHGSRFTAAETILLNVWDLPSQTPASNNTFAIKTRGNVDLTYQLVLSKGFVFLLSKRLEDCLALDLRACTTNENDTAEPSRAAVCWPWRSEEVKSLVPYDERGLNWDSIFTGRVNRAFYAGFHHWKAGSYVEVEMHGTVSNIKA